MFLEYKKGSFLHHPLSVSKDMILLQLMKSLITMVEEELVYSGLIEMQKMDAPGDRSPGDTKCPTPST